MEYWISFWTTQAFTKSWAHMHNELHTYESLVSAVTGEEHLPPDLLLSDPLLCFFGSVLLRVDLNIIDINLN